MADTGPGKFFFGADKTSRSVWVVVDPKDFVTGSRVTSPLRVRLKDVTAEPIAARSGVYCFNDLNLPAAKYTVQIKPARPDRYFDSETTFTLTTIPVLSPPLSRNPVLVQLMPRPSYPFDAQATLARGRLIKDSDSSPIPDAQIFLIQDTVDKGLRGQTDQRGEFAVFFPPEPPNQTNPAADLKVFKFQLRFEIPNHAPHLTAETTVKEGTTKSLNEIKFPGT